MYAKPDVSKNLMAFAMKYVDRSNGLIKIFYMKLLFHIVYYVGKMSKLYNICLNCHMPKLSKCMVITNVSLADVAIINRMGAV